MLISAVKHILIFILLRIKRQGIQRKEAKAQRRRGHLWTVNDSMNTIFYGILAKINDQTELHTC